MSDLDDLVGREAARDFLRFLCGAVLLGAVVGFAVAILLLGCAAPAQADVDWQWSITEERFEVDCTKRPDLCRMAAVIGRLKPEERCANLDECEQGWSIRYDGSKAQCECVPPKPKRKPREKHCFQVGCRTISDDGSPPCTMVGCLVNHTNERTVCDTFCVRGRLEKHD